MIHACYSLLKIEECGEVFKDTYIPIRRKNTSRIKNISSTSRLSVIGNCTNKKLAQNQPQNPAMSGK